jgi:hypothetical protein
LACVRRQGAAAQREDDVERAVPVREEQYQDGGAAGKGAVVPLGWGRIIGAEAGEGLLVGLSDLYLSCGSVD